MTEPLYSIGDYEVRIKETEDTRIYVVVNSNTGVVEYENKSLPRCMCIADESDDYLKRHAEYEKKEAPKESKIASIVSLVPKEDTI